MLSAGADGRLECSNLMEEGGQEGSPGRALWHFLKSQRRSYVGAETGPPILGLAVGRVSPKAGDRGLLMAPLKPLTWSQWITGSLRWVSSWGGINERGVWERGEL